MTVHSVLLLSILSAFLQIRWNGPTSAIQLLAMLKVHKYCGHYQTSWVWEQTQLALIFTVKQKSRKHSLFHELQKCIRRTVTVAKINDTDTLQCPIQMNPQEHKMSLTHSSLFVNSRFTYVSYKSP
jgi:hypothetical protein